MNNIFKEVPEFYPTPVALMQKMFSEIDLSKIKYVLEPSAGSGNLAKFCEILAEVLEDRYYRRIVSNRVDDNLSNNEYNAAFIKSAVAYAAEKYEKVNLDDEPYRYHTDSNLEIDCIEADPDLRAVLKGNGFSVVDTDFLSFYTEKKYDLIVMNPPFSNGEEHLLKAIELQERFGGQIICLLNAETIRNPYSNMRKLLSNKLNEHHAKVEFIQNAFSSAERKTDVEIALIRVNITPKTEFHSLILDELEKAPEIELESVKGCENLITNDVISASVIQYREEIRAGKKLLQEYQALRPLLSTTFEKEGSKVPILRLTLGEDSKYSYTEVDFNKYLKRVRYKYWYELLHNAKFLGNLTSNLRDEYFRKIDEFAECDYNLGNIYRLKIDILQQMIRGVEDKILELFERFTYKHSCECEGNIHYFNGWKSNSAFMINKKVVIPWMRTWDDIFKKFNYTYELNNMLSDIEKTLRFLETNPLDCHRDISHWLKYYQDNQQTKKLEFDYFSINVYKKGTVHLTFTNDELLKKLNIYGCQKKGWLPPSYGQKHYSDMSKEEQRVVDEFEGKESYEKLMTNPQKYIPDSSRFLALTDGRSGN